MFDAHSYTLSYTIARRTILLCHEESITRGRIAKKSGYPRSIWKILSAAVFSESRANGWQVSKLYVILCKQRVDLLLNVTPREFTHPHCLVYSLTRNYSTSVLKKTGCSYVQIEQLSLTSLAQKRSKYCAALERSRLGKWTSIYWHSRQEQELRLHKHENQVLHTQPEPCVTSKSTAWRTNV